MIRIAFAEDNSFLAHAIEEKLSAFSDLKLKFSATNGAELIGKLEQDHNLDVVLMDIEMPVIDGIKATELLRKKYPHILIIMLTVFDDESKIFSSIMAGANGYLLKDEPANVIYDSIKDIINGGAPMSPAIALKALKILRRPDLVETRPLALETKLSDREVEVLSQLGQGLSYTRIAENLIISPSTVRKHIEKIYKKLQVHSKLEAIDLGREHGLI